MTLLIEILLAIFLHPIVVILVWINLVGRRDIGLVKKLLWGIVAMVSTRQQLLHLGPLVRRDLWQLLSHLTTPSWPRYSSAS